MNGWHDHFHSRTCTAAEAVARVRSGQLIAMGQACGEPRLLPKALVARAAELRDVRITHMISMGESLYCKPEYEESFRHISLFVGGTSREAVWENRADYFPCFFSQIPALFDHELPPDVAMVTVSPPDANGMCSLGVSVDYTKKAVECAPLVIAEVNPKMPRTHGDSFVPVSAIDYFVESDQPIHELKGIELTETEKAIGRHAAELIDDGACLQLGIGGIPDAVLFNLTGCKDLGIHSEMISDGVQNLVEKGVITGSRKTIHQGKIIVTFLMGTRAFYDWIDDNPLIEMKSVDYTNDVRIIAKNRGMVSINAALEVDLLGQVCADTLGPKQYSAVGGQLDFVRGSRMSEGGKSIIALSSTAKGAVSKIVPRLKEGAAVTTSRFDVDYIVTEHGSAHLRGATVRERMRRLIAIADPAAREELTRAAFETYHVRV
ncbi:MAG: 4-hydroxybutyrate CoA-transferase [Deltaproteobacteria bacterium]|nr:4-hydroxybutyrate CoA-transferase [Deltaproteobacteria bacterium]